MELRQSPRVVIAMKLLMYQQGVPVAIARIRNASERGLFVETDFAAIDMQQPLEVELLPRASTHIDRCRFRTRIVRRAADGLGLEVDAFNETGHNVLTTMVNSDLVTGRGWPGPLR